MFKWLYFANAIISFLAVVYYFETTLNKVNQKQLMILMFTALSNWAYFFAATAKTLEGYYIAYSIYYMGIIFTVILLILIITELCGFKNNKTFRRFFLLYGVIIIYLVVSVPNNQLYYVSYTLAQDKGISYLIKEYGPLHILLLVFIFGSNLLCLFMIIYSFCKKRAASLNITLLLLVIFTISSFVYLIPKLFHIPQEGMPFSFTIIDILFVLIFKRASMYDMSSNLLNVFEQRQEYGYIAFDKKYRYVGANDFALKLFPELNNVRIDSKINVENCDLTEKLLPWLFEWSNNSQKNFVYTKDDITVACSKKFITNENKNVGYLIEMRDVSKQQQYINLISTYNMQLETKVEEKTLKIQEIQDSIISGMAMMVESRDNSTGGHIKRTSEGVKIFVEELVKHNENWHFTETFCKNIIKAAPMHDLGKIAVDDKILRKPGKFEPEEYEQMKKHSAEGARIVNQVLFYVDDEDFVRTAVNIAHFHHEKWNGTGYPECLKEEEIPIEARIMAFADVFDALVSKRCYKNSFTFDKAFDIIKNDLGTHFDPELGKIFLQCRPQLEAYYSNLNE
ncbi:MAG: HD domain-containing protein [Treponema sp.]|nr:HD domain-containing protein [Treponema sp.]